MHTVCPKYIQLPFCEIFIIWKIEKIHLSLNVLFFINDWLIIGSSKEEFLRGNLSMNNLPKEVLPMETKTFSQIFLPHTLQTKIMDEHLD